ncbi:hypothetical protein KJ068_26415 [bacterium]|nr:hypothetical protein [bacterium]
MGNYQLLTFILAAIIIGFAFVLGVEAFRDTPFNQQEQEIRGMLLDAAMRAQAYYRRPVQMAGGGRSFATVSWAKLNVNPNTPIATLTLSHKQQKSVCLTGVSLTDPAVIIGYRVYADSLAVLH